MLTEKSEHMPTDSSRRVCSISLMSIIETVSTISTIGAVSSISIMSTIGSSKKI